MGTWEFVTNHAQVLLCIANDPGARRRNRYQIRADRPLPEPASRRPTVGELLAVLAHTSTIREEG